MENWSRSFRNLFLAIAVFIFLIHQVSSIAFEGENSASRTVGTLSTIYNFNVSFKSDTGKQSVACDVVLSRDNTTDAKDIWLVSNNNRCIWDGCPSRISFVGADDQGTTRKGTLQAEDDNKLTGDIYVFLTCVDNSAKCSFANDLSATCFTPTDYVRFLFTDGFDTPAEPLSQATLTIADSYKVGDNVTFSATISPTNVGPVTYSWDFGDAIESNLTSPTHSYAEAGKYVVTLVIKSLFNQVSTSKEITITADIDNNGTPNNNKGNGGKIAGIVIGILLILIFLIALIWYLRKNKDKLKSFKESFNVKKSESSIPVTELRYNNHPSDDHEKNLHQAEYADESVNQELVYPPFTRNYEEFVSEVTNAEISPLVVDCCQYLREKGYDVEGIFRVPGSQSEMQALKSSYEKGDNPSLKDIKEPLTVAGLLKLFCREGREEIVPKSAYALLISAKSDIEKHRSVVFSLTARQIKTLKTILDLFVFITQHAEVNLMHPDNLAKVFGPSLFKEMPVGSASSVMSVWIKNNDQIFGL